MKENAHLKNFVALNLLVNANASVGFESWKTL